MGRHKTGPIYVALAVSLVISLAMVIAGLAFVESLNGPMLINRLLWPLCRLILLIGVGLVVGQVIEASGWTHALASLTGPFFRYANLAPQCGAAFTAAFASGVAANAMLLDSYRDGKICRQELFLANFINQVPAYFLHLPTTVFIVIPLTGWAGGLYFLLTFLALLLRTGLFVLYGHLRPGIRACDTRIDAPADTPETPRPPQSVWAGIAAKFPARIVNITVWVVPIYVAVFIANALGLFDMARDWLAGYVVTAFIPVEALSLVILSFVAEFTSGFAAAGALMQAGVITVKQTALALLIGNIIAFPIRALRHQLPRYMGIFSPRMGIELLVLGQGFRVASLIVVGLIYYVVG